MIILCKGNTVTMVYNEGLDLKSLGGLSIRRASRVEPTPDGLWTADLSPLGPVLGPFTKRSQALLAEADWIENHLHKFTNQINKGGLN